MATIYKYRNKYYIAYYLGGKRKAVNTKLSYIKENYRKAEKMKEAIEVNIEGKGQDSSQNRFVNGITNSNEATSLINLVAKCYKERIEMKSAAHQKNYRIAISHLYNVVSPSTDVKKITSGDISKVIATFMKEMSNATMFTYIQYLKIFFNFLVEEDYLSKSPIKKKLIPKRGRNSIVVFDDIVLKQILNETLKRDKNLYNCYMLLLLTGIRPIDLINLKVGNFDLEKKLINIRMSKTLKEIQFPIYDELLQYINENLKSELEKNPNKILFENFSVEILGKRFRRIKKFLNIKEQFSVTLKTFRKTFATRMAERGLYMEEVANLLGHDDIRTTSKYYAKIVTEKLRNRIDNMYNPEVGTRELLTNC